MTHLAEIILGSFVGSSLTLGVAALLWLSTRASRDRDDRPPREEPTR